jgi:wyosine [tRNA(Phe)-imidazoG37] synthetase (radical SAM superfamily)
MSATLSAVDHSRESAGLQYVYPVVSRRAGGVSVGINLNTNNACNWRCIYCQVPNLILGSAPSVDLGLLEAELRNFLRELLHGSFMLQRVPENSRRINDIALSGNGEPTSAKEFAQVIELVGNVMKEISLPQHIKLILITNGSLMHRPYVQEGLQRLSESRGEVWFKFDRASEQGMQLVNNTRSTIAHVRENLATAISLCPTWLQTCWFAVDGAAPGKQDEDDYLDFISGLLNDNIRPRGIMLYSLARASHQPEAARLGALDQANIESFASRIRLLHIEVKVAV